MHHKMTSAIFLLLHFRFSVIRMKITMVKTISNEKCANNVEKYFSHAVATCCVVFLMFRRRCFCFVYFYWMPATHNSYSLQQLQRLIMASLWCIFNFSRKWVAVGYEYCIKSVHDSDEKIKKQQETTVADCVWIYGWKEKMKKLQLK